MTRNLSRFLAAVVAAQLALPAWAQTVVRGPYLQQLTDSSVIVRWRTDIATNSVVRFGTVEGNLPGTVSLSGSRTEHSVTVSGLADSTRYYYSVGNSGGALAGDASYFFGTAPPPGVASATRIWVLGDSGTANSNAAAVRNAFQSWSASGPADFMLMLGDNAYEDGTDAEYQAAVFDMYPLQLRQLPLWSTLGNHDGHTASSDTQSGPYYDIFQLPTAGEAGGLASGTEAYYAFDYGNIHFVVLDSYDSDTSPAGNMMTWLEADLATNDLPWVIAFWHHPPYSKGSHNSDSEAQLIDMRQNALPILEAWGVDLVMTGHSHSYERSYLLDGHYGTSTTLDPDEHIIDPGDGDEAGDGAYQKPGIIAAEHAGAVYAVAGSSGKISGGTLNHPAMVVSINVLGSMVIDVAGDRLDGYFLDNGGVVRDRFTLLKAPDAEPPLLVAAQALDASHVQVGFSERLDVASASSAANFSIPGLAVSQAVLQPGNRDVLLDTSTMSPGTNYVLTVNNVEDESGNPIAPGSQVGFQFNEYMSRAFQDGLAPEPGYGGTRDSYIRQATPTTNYGAAASLLVDGDEPAGTGNDMSILLAWDVSSLPPMAVIDSATIVLNNTNAGGPYSCFAVLRPWEELSATWNLAAAGNAWSVPGAKGAGDAGSLPLCTVSTGVTGPLAIALNTDGLDVVQGWVDGSRPNHGLLIANSSSTDGADFHSSESATALSRPRLEVGYYVPVTPPALPAAPSGLSATPWSSARIDIAWADNSNNEDGFAVEHSANGVSGWVVAATLGASLTAWSHTGLEAGSPHHYRVSAFNSAGSSAPSNHASASTFSVPRTLQFSGRSWTVKASAGPVGPGPNLFGDTADDVWVDSNGYLHLRTEFRDGQWHSSEVVGDEVLGYGTYTFTLGSRVDLLDPNIVVGLFTWDSGAPQFNYREIDIEFARWGAAGNDNSQYVVQPYTNPANILRWNTALAGTDSTHGFTWRPDRVEFTSHQGHPPGAAIQAWTYSGPDVPPAGTVSGNARINFWLFGGAAPSNGQEAELVVKAFDFEPLQGATDHFAQADLPVAGTVNGSFANTHGDDGSAQSITERESGGRKNQRYSYLEHRWQFSIPPSAMATVYANMWHGGSPDDHFVLAWSADNTTFSPLFPVTSTSPANTQSAVLPGSPSGNIYLRITDSNQVMGNVSLDTVFIDQMFIRTDSAPGQPPAAPGVLSAVANGHDTVNLGWLDNSSDESGFEIERSINGGSFAALTGVGPNQAAYSDTGLAGSTTYGYRVRAFNASGASAWSDVASATTPAPPPPPAITLSLTGSKNKGLHAVALGWGGATGTSVDIYRDGSLLITTANDGSHTDQTGNKGGRTYAYRVCNAGTAVCSSTEQITF